LSFDVNIISHLDFWWWVIIHDGCMEMHGRSVCVGVREVVQGKGSANDEEGWRCFDGRKKKGGSEGWQRWMGSVCRKLGDRTRTNRGKSRVIWGKKKKEEGRLC
jgi:hypothetical protein